MADWFEQQGTPLPALPAQVGELTLVGARYCPLASVTSAPHVYYASAGKHVSVFVLQQGVRFDDRLAAHARGDSIRLLRLEGQVVGIVGEREADVQAFEDSPAARARRVGEASR